MVTKKIPPEKINGSNTLVVYIRSLVSIICLTGCFVTLNPKP